MEDNGNLSKFVDQFNDNPANGAALVRKSAISIEKQYGTVWLGLQVIGVLSTFHQLPISRQDVEGAIHQLLEVAADSLPPGKRP